jgi:hypothetical protein
MPRYILFLHEDEQIFANRSPEEMMKVIERYSAWSRSLAEKGQMAGGEKLTDGKGRVLRPGGKEILVTDGPYAETRETVGGFFIVTAPDLEAAEAIARTCPHLSYGGRIELREIEEF